MARIARLTFGLLVIAALAGVAWLIWVRLHEARGDAPRAAGAPRPAAVEVAPVAHGPIELRRAFSGALEARAQFSLAPKVAGRVEQLAVDLSDTVKRGQVVAELDDDEFVQAVNQAEADLAVATATLSQSQSASLIADRELERVRTLRERGVASDSQFDEATSDHLSKQAAVKVAEAQVTRAKAVVQTAKIRLGYTKVTATWSGDDDERIVADRFVDEGETVAANAPLMSIIMLDPIDAVVYATEKDYARLHPGQSVTLVTDAYPDRVFKGEITRIAPVFRQASRQARLEIKVDNPQRQLKPGLFVRAEVVLDRAENATIIPVDALASRDGEDGVFIVEADGKKVSWRPVKVGIRDNKRVQVEGEGVVGRVVTLGQQLVRDGAPITIPGDKADEPKAKTPAAPEAAATPSQPATTGSAQNPPAKPSTETGP